jgi:surface polysaccharide O-acyltransferase-like enzyme
MGGNQRILNFEILRILSMFFILIWHFCGLGVLRVDNSEIIPSFSTNFYSILNFFLLNGVVSVCAVGVNCFVMITGYFMINKTNIRVMKAEQVWFQTLFYSVLIAVVFMLFEWAPYSIGKIGSAFIVVATQKYWFVTMYLALILLSPFLSMLAKQLTKKQYMFLLMIFGLISMRIFKFFPYGNTYFSYGGYSLLWFIFVYFVAGYIRLFNPFPNYRKNRDLFFIMVGVVFIYNIISNMMDYHFIETNTLVLKSLPVYNGFVFIESFFFFLWFKNIKFNSSIWSSLSKISPYVFAVYLIHDNSYIVSVWQSKLEMFNYIDKPVLIPLMIMFGMIMFVICVIIDSGRSVLFRYIGITKMFNKLNRIALRISSRHFNTIS